MISGVQKEFYLFKAAFILEPCLRLPNASKTLLGWPPQPCPFLSQ